MTAHASSSQFLSACPFTVLGLEAPRNPSQFDGRAISKAYRRQSLLHHPDKLPPDADAATIAAARDCFEAIQKAYTVLLGDHGGDETAASHFYFNTFLREQQQHGTASNSSGTGAAAGGGAGGTSAYEQYAQARQQEEQGRREDAARAAAQRRVQQEILRQAAAAAKQSATAAAELRRAQAAIALGSIVYGEEPSNGSSSSSAAFPSSAMHRSSTSAAAAAMAARELEQQLMTRWECDAWDLLSMKATEVLGDGISIDVENSAVETSHDSSLQKVTLRPSLTRLARLWTLFDTHSEEANTEDHSTTTLDATIPVREQPVKFLRSEV